MLPNLDAAQLEDSETLIVFEKILSFIEVMAFLRVEVPFHGLSRKNLKMGKIGKSKFWKFWKNKYIVVKYGGLVSQNYY